VSCLIKLVGITGNQVILEFVCVEEDDFSCNKPFPYQLMAAFKKCRITNGVYVCFSVYSTLVIIGNCFVNSLSFVIFPMFHFQL